VVIIASRIRAGQRCGNREA